MVYTESATLSGYDYTQSVTVSTTVTADAPGYAGLYLWDIEVTNNNFQPLGSGDGVEMFYLNVEDLSAVVDAGGGTLSEEYALAGGPAVYWALGEGEMGAMGPGGSADVQLVTEPVEIGQGGGVCNPGAAVALNGPAAAPGQKNNNQVVLDFNTATTGVAYYIILVFKSGNTVVGTTGPVPISADANRFDIQAAIIDAMAGDILAKPVSDISSAVKFIGDAGQPITSVEMFTKSTLNGPMDTNLNPGRLSYAGPGVTSVKINGVEKQPQ